MTITYRSLDAKSPGFSQALARLERRGETDLERVEPVVKEILASVRAGGDAAVLGYVEKHEQRRPAQLLVRDYDGKAALEALPAAVRTALELSATRVRRYHEEQKRHLQGFAYEENGVTLESRVAAVDKAGVYAPGGKAKYPSSVLMTAIPARVAGVREIILACPQISVEVRAAAHLAGVTAILDAGGAQAVAALAYGTESVPRVDKIVGPGNLYVTAAKRLVFGEVDIDSLAGPSEILVIADDDANPRWVAADLISQAEHDEAAYALLLCRSEGFVERVRAELERQLADLPRRNIAEASLNENGLAFVVHERAELARVATLLAAEHVAVHTAEPAELARGVLRAGAIFVGPMTPEAAGDYVAGPSHVLPTGGAVRYGSPLGVYHFVSRTSLISYEAAALRDQAGSIAAFARAEGLDGHARAVEVRLER
ncbi:MAG: Histidinol dehydrogenase [Polyangiaceae bacterium]|jgi:histidinol dehydrogenase|nr:Histidinol dehydrogenase [Polyangiaceae bacterium]